MYVDIMASILRVISNDLYLNLVERNLIYPKTCTETDSCVESAGEVSLLHLPSLLIYIMMYVTADDKCDTKP
jgi:hypothetical protein